MATTRTPTAEQEHLEAWFGFGSKILSLGCQHKVKWLSQTLATGMPSIRQSVATDPTVKRFKDWNEILRHAKGGDNDQDAESVDKELGAAVKFVEKHGYQTPEILDLIVSRSGAPSQAIASFSTAHRAKGLEWDYVKILDDFPKLGSEMERDENGELQLPDEQELNLLYVAVTRGRKWVDLNEDILEFVEMEFPHHFEELRPSNVLQRNKARLSEESVTASV